MESALYLLGAGLISLLAALFCVQNIRDAVKTGIVADRTGKYDRRKNPKLYKLVFGSNVLAIVVFGLAGTGCLGFGIFLLINSN